MNNHPEEIFDLKYTNIVFQTREERKMEAIMKAFQKMEEREQRRKEAAQHQHTHEVHKEVTPAPSTGKAAARTKSGKSKSVDESKLKDSASVKSTKETASGKGSQSSAGKAPQAPAPAVKVKEDVKPEPAPPAVSSPPAREKSPEVQVRTLRSNTMPRTKAASKAMPPGLIMDTSQFNSLPPPQLEAIKVFYYLTYYLSLTDALPLQLYQTS